MPHEPPARRYRVRVDGSADGPVPETAAREVAEEVTAKDAGQVTGEVAGTGIVTNDDLSRMIGNDPSPDRPAKIPAHDHRILEFA